MPRIAKSVATLRVFGSELVPEHVSALLGASPTESYRKGDVKILSSGKELIRKTGIWRLEVPDCEPEDLEGQVVKLLASLTTDLTVWRPNAVRRLCQPVDDREHQNDRVHASAAERARRSNGERQG